MRRILTIGPGLALVGAMVLWGFSVQGHWTRDVHHRYAGWAWLCSLALAGVLLGRLSTSRSWRIPVTVLGTAGCLVMAVLIWRYAGRQGYPEAASALGVVALGLSASAGLLGVAYDFWVERHDRRVAIVGLAVAGLLVGTAGLSTIDWHDRPLDLRQASGPEPSGPTPAAPGKVIWSNAGDVPAGTRITDVRSDGSLLFVAFDGRRTGVAALDPRTGRARWTWSRPSVGFDADADIAVGDGAVAVTMDEETALLDPATGRQETEFASPLGDNQPTIAGHQAVGINTTDESFQVGTHPLGAGSTRKTTTAVSYDPTCQGIGFVGGLSHTNAVAAATALVFKNICFDPAAGEVQIGLVDPSGPDPVRTIKIPGPVTFPDLDPSAPALYGRLILADGILVGSVGPESSETGSALEFAVNAGSGKVLWHRSAPSRSGVAEGAGWVLGVGPSGVIAMDGAGHLGTVDLHTGATRVTTDVSGPVVSAAVAGSHLYAAVPGRGEQALITVDLRTGTSTRGPVLRTGGDDPLDDTAVAPAAGALVFVQGVALGDPRLTAYQ